MLKRASSAFPSALAITWISAWLPAQVTYRIGLYGTPASPLLALCGVCCGLWLLIRLPVGWVRSTVVMVYVPLALALASATLLLTACSFGDCL